MKDHHGDVTGNAAPEGEGGIRWLRLLAFAPVAALAAFIAGWLARLSGVSWKFTVVYGAIVAVGVLLGSFSGTTDNLADAGRGLIVAIMLALIASSISHREDVRNRQSAHQEAVRNKQSDLRLTLSSGKAFAGIDLRGRHLSGFYIGRKNLSEAKLQGADLSGAVLQHTNLSKADLHGSGTNLSHADLSFADLRNADLRLANLNDANLTEAKLDGARLAGAQLRNAKLDGAHAQGVDLRDADLHGALLPGTDLRMALLDGADLRGSDFNEDLREATLDGAAMSGVLSNAGTPSGTRWPDGFKLADAVAEARAPPKRPLPVPPEATKDVVVRVVDGDTLVLRHLGHVRLLAINAPGEEPPAECYGRRATADVKRLVPVETRVRYTLGSTGEDDFDRKLAYLWLDSGVFVNERIVEDGDALFQPQPHKRRLPDVERSYARRIKKAVIRSDMARRGLWGACSPTKR